MHIGWRARVAGALGIMAMVLAAGAGLGASKADAAKTLTVRAGDGEPGYAVNVFLASKVRVNTGDTVRWTNDWWEPHTVTFGIPQGDPTVPSNPGAGTIAYDGTGYFSSGLVFGEPGSATDVASIRFTKKGEYTYVCVIHPNMVGTVTVVDTADVDSQASVDARGAAEYTSGILALKADQASLANTPTKVTKAADGSTKYSVRAGGESFDGDVMQFFAPSLKVKAGDTVEFINPNHAPHNVMLGAGPPPGEPFAWPGSDVSKGYDGTGVVMSPMLGEAFGTATSWTLKFTKAGTYSYVCLLHAPQGMAGTITVEAAAPPAAPKPPATGSGVQVVGGIPLAFLIFVGLLLAAGAGVASLRATRSEGRERA